MTGTTAAVDTVARIGSGVAVGAVGAAVTALVAVVVRRRLPTSTVPIAGLLLVAAAVAALHRAGPETLVSRRLVIGLAVLAAGPTLVTIVGATRRRRSPAWTSLLAAVPGALLVADAAARAGNHPGPWARPLVLVTALVGGAAAAASDRATAPAGLGPVLVALACCAAFTTLPDTEQIGAVAGVALPFALVGAPVALARLGPGAYAVCGLLAWSAAVGGTGRPGAAIGAVAGLGVLLVLPAARWVRRGHAHLPTRPLDRRALTLTAVQAVTLVVTARVAGLRQSLGGAAVVAGPMLLVTLAAVVVVLGPTRRATPDPAPPRTMARNEPTR